MGASKRAAVTMVIAALSVGAIVDRVYAQSPMIGVLAGRGPAPLDEGLLLGVEAHLPLRSMAWLRIIGTRVTAQGSSALQAALLLQAVPWRGRVRPYLAGGPLLRHVRFPQTPTVDQTDSFVGLLGAAGADVRVDRCGRARLFFEVHAMAASGVGSEFGGGIRIGLGGCDSGPGPK